MRFTPRRLLSVVCSSFGDVLAEDDAIPYPPLLFAAPLAARLAEGLADFGYTAVEPLVDLPATEMGQQVEEFLDSCGADEVVVVHIIGHGVVHERTAKLLVVGSDRQANAHTEVERWLTTVEGRAGGAAPSVLFLVDLCYAGAVTRLDWQGQIPDEHRRAWVIAATGQRDPAYAGRFTEATAVVLTRIAAGALDIAASYEFVPVERVAREIRREVDRLAEGSYEQRVVSIRSDPAAIPNFPFISNPAYVEGPTVRIDETTRPFLDDVDEALDWRHFAGRAAGGSLEIEGERVRPGAFRGRRSQLRTIADVFDAPSPGPCLAYVTGKPGVGKSALLGITVCATHPELSDLTEPLWRDHRDDLPAVHDGLAAVHCRQRPLDEIVAALARQLGVSETTSDPTALVKAVTDAGTVPLVVLDALDESIAPTKVMTGLILPLATVARVIVGVRPWPEFQPLRDQATTVIDLDDVSVAELRVDLTAYIDDLLRPAYRTAALRESRQVIAGHVAAALTELARTEDTEWGAFLVAGLYAHQLRNRPAITDRAEAKSVGLAVPQTLPKVFELDLAIDDSRVWRPVLTVLAHSFGAGIPRSLVDAVVGADTAAEGLDTARFYLRRDTDEDGTVLYRLFHQGLADDLKRQDPSGGEAVFTALMSSLGSPPRWRDAEPYVLRHAADHAYSASQYRTLCDDPGFLTFGASSAVARREVHVDGSPTATTLVYRKSLQQHRDLSPVRRRSVLAIDAHRLGYRALSTQLARIADLPALGWTPLWATTDLDYLQRWRHEMNNIEPSSLVIGGGSGAPMVAVSDWTGLTVTDIGTGEVTANSFQSLGAKCRCLAVGRYDGRVAALVRRGDGSLELWDVADQSSLVTFPSVGVVHLVVFAETAGVPLLVVVDLVKGVSTWRLSDGELNDQYEFSRPVEAAAVGSLAGQMVVATAWDHRLELIRIAGHPTRASVDTGARIVSLAVGEFTGQGVVLCGHQDGTVDLWSAENMTRVRRLAPDEVGTMFGKGSSSGPLTFGEHDGVPTVFMAHQFGFVSVSDVVSGLRLPGSVSVLGSLTALLPGTIADRSVVVATNGQKVGVYNTTTGQRVTAFAPTKRRSVDFGQDGPVVTQEHTGPVRGVAVLDNLVASASSDRTVQLWDLDTGTPGRLFDRYRDEMYIFALGRSDGRRVALTRSADCSARLWDVDSGRPLHVLAGHIRQVCAAAFTQDERHAVTAAHDSTVRIWDLDKGNCVRVYSTARRTRFTSVACGPFAVAGGTDGLVHVWRSPHERTFSGHDGPVWTVALSQVDGADVVLSGGEDRVVRMWRASDGACVRTFTGFTAEVTTVSTGWWRDRPVVLAGSEDSTVLGWDLQDGALLAEATFPGTVRAVAVGTEGRVVVGFGNDVGVIQLRS